jgi:putative AdoMet-dependent methyltransferase
MKDRELFDAMAPGYDQEVAECDEKGRFPYAGYDRVLDFIASEIEHDPHVGTIRILDLGIGTGNLESRIKPGKISVVGVDLSPKMLEIAQLKLPEARLILGDYRWGLPEELLTDKFDLIVSTYSFHHLSFDEWIELVHYLSQRLTVFGKIFIGDILFANAAEKAHCRTDHAEDWDEDEQDHYHVFEDLRRRVCDHLAVSFLKLSYCAGVVIVENYHECLEHFGKTCEKTLKFGK